ncbi:MAG: sterol desaturase family protein [Methylobacter sp.]|nr:sterol desaturase family protein [Methylobacter sp.]
METYVRSSVFFSILLLRIVWELLSPKRRLRQERWQRWSINLGLAALNVAVIWLSVGAVAWLAANWALSQQVGLFNMMSMPHWLVVVLSLLLLDLAIYAQHVASHHWMFFWRLHQVHHTDLDFDTTTAVRFHPFEIMLSMLYKVVLVILLGADPSAVIAFEIILNGCALFNHGNVRLSPNWERRLRYWLVTPDMHRIHHSVLRKEIDSNYGFSLSCWDKLFKTYIAKSQQPQTEMSLGLSVFRESAELSFIKLLIMPFQHLRGH